MANENLLGAKKLGQPVIAIIIKGPANKLQQCLKTTTTFATIPNQLTRFHNFFAFGTKFPKNSFVCFRVWFVKVADKTLVKFVIAYQQYCFLRYL